MRGGPAHVEVSDGRPVLRPTRRGPKEEELLHGKLALENIPFRQTEGPFQVQWSDDLLVEDLVTDVRGMFGQRVDNRLAERVAYVVPGSLLQVVGGVLDEAGT